MFLFSDCLGINGSLVAVPWMLLPKPFLLKRQHEQRHQGQTYIPLESSDDSVH
ncbi:unnamed protein product [Rhodiola kirilowii]